MASQHEKDVERGPLQQQEDGEKQGTQATPRGTHASSLIWMVVNTLATIGIVFTNKAIFSTRALRQSQLTFAAFHFALTWLGLHLLSRRRGPALFEPRRAPLGDLLPLALAMALNVVLPNLSLAHSSVAAYQLARPLLTPAVALLHYALHGSAPPPAALLALVPACAGAGLVSYHDGGGGGGGGGTAADPRGSSPGLGLGLAAAGVLASALYTVWVAGCRARLGLSSMQLLLRQAPVSTLLLLYAIPFLDRFPVWAEVSAGSWALVFMSGMFACLINISQFFIIAQTGPVASTLVGHVKTCTIVALGWATSGRDMGDKSVLGIFMALGGIIAYSKIMLKHTTAQEKK